MESTITQATGSAEAALAAAQPKPTKPKPTKQKPNKKAAVAKKGAHVAPATAKATKKASAEKKAPKGQKKAPKSQKNAAARDGSKTAKVLDLLKRPDGVTLKELMKVTGWQAHSVRGFLSGTLRKKMGLAVTSTKGEDGERSYSVKA